MAPPNRQILFASVDEEASTADLSGHPHNPPEQILLEHSLAAVHATLFAFLLHLPLVQPPLLHSLAAAQVALSSFLAEQDTAY